MEEERRGKPRLPQLVGLSAIFPESAASSMKHHTVPLYSLIDARLSSAIASTISGVVSRAEFRLDRRAEIRTISPPVR